MADSLSTLGSIATFLASSLSLPVGISGNLVIIVDMARQHVAQYTGVTIGSNSIPENYQGAIVDFAKADLVDFLAMDGQGNISLSDLSVGGIDLNMTSDQYRKLGEMKLQALGKNYQFSQSLS